MAKFVVFAKRVDPMEARLRVFCMTDDREDKTLEQQENFTEVAKSRDVEVLENKIQYLELAGNLIPVTKSGDQLQFPFKAFKENRLPFSARVKDQHADTVGRALFMREPKVAKGEPPQSPICILNIVLPEDIIPDALSMHDGSQEIISRVEYSSQFRKYPDEHQAVELRMSDVSNLLGDDWIKLAPEIGISDQEIEDIIENYPNSTAQQAQAMLKLFQSKKQNDINILENGLRSIGRDDIVERCLVRTITTTTTTTVTRRHPKRTSDTNGYEESDLIKDSESLEDLNNKKRYARYEHDESKYSAEEKAVESDEDEAAKKSVAERREKIVKRLSGEQKHLPSHQQKEIVEEIITIKRQSLIEDVRAKHEDEILMQKPVDNSYKSATVNEQVVKLKTTSHDSSSIDKSDFEKELQEKFHSTLGDVDKFEHKFTQEKIIPVTHDFLAHEIQQAGAGVPDRSVTTVTKTTTVRESAPGDFESNGRQDSPHVVKREVVTTTTTYTDDDGFVKQTKTVYDQGDDEFERIEREVMDPAMVDEILEEARQKADNIQSKTVTTTKVQPGETKEIITTTTIRTIESINLDDVSDAHRQYSDDEELIQRKVVETG
jgi:UPA domain/Death domain